MTDERQHSPDEREQRIREAIRSSGEVRADAAFRERLKREFSSGALSAPDVQDERSPARGFPRWAWVALPAAAVILLFALLLPRTPVPAWSVQAVRGEGRIEIDGEAVESSDTDRLEQLLASGGHVLLDQAVSIDLRLNDRLILALDEGSDVTLPAPPDTTVTNTLIADVHGGEMHVMTGPGFPGTAMHILTSDGRTEITGTNISVYKGDGYTCVCVLEGTALIGPDEQRLEEIGEGLLMLMFDGGGDPMVLDISSDHEAGLLEFEDRYRGAFEQPD